MNVFLDNIIFSLQKSGGISVVWYELLKRILIDSEINPLFLETPGINIFRGNLSISDDKTLKNPFVKYPINIQRFLNPGHFKTKGIFHSSYYRFGVGPDIANITTVHDFTYEHFRKGIAKQIHHRQKDLAIKNSKRIICVSNNTKTELLKFYPKLDPEIVKVIYNGVSDIYRPLLMKGGLDLKKIMDFDSDGFILFIGGRKFEYENYITVVKACKLLKVPLVLVGGGPLSHSESRYLSENLGSNRYKVLHEISSNELNIIYNNALCLVYPSISEGFGLPVVEAQRAGCPVISTIFSSIPEVAGKGAILLEEISARHIAESISTIINDRNLVGRIKEEGFRNSMNFSWDKCYDQTKALYKEVYEEFL